LITSDQPTAVHKHLQPTMAALSRLSLFLFLIFNFSIRLVNCSGVLQFRISSFQNYDSLDVHGRCCGAATSGKSSNRTCSSTGCRLVFRVCLKQYENEINADPPCTYGTHVADASDKHGSLFSLLRQPGSLSVTGSIVTFPITFSWPGTLSMIVEAWHVTNELFQIGTANADAKLISSGQLLLRVAERKTLLAGGDKWTVGEYNNGHSRLRIQLRVVCDDHYYGPHCNVFCKDKDDSGGHYTCAKNGTKVCLAGWQAPKCKDAICKPGCHPQYGSCQRPGECECQSGYMGVNCDQCQRYPGCQHGTCNKPFTCICEEGWGGVYCNQDLNYCTHHKPCQNGATCQNTGAGSYTCSCPTGFSGTNCELRIETCLASPCRNGGTCKQSAGNYTCNCAAGFSGRHCQTSAKSCQEKPCENGATCVSAPASKNGYSCLCAAGWEGTNCDIERDECKLEPCLNGGRCVSKFGGFQCVCPMGFEGKRCERNVDDCTEAACLNGGTCEDEVNNFRCHCPPGFMGTLCQINVDECARRPCANGGTCLDLINDFRCLCRDGYKGKDCSIAVDECASNPCRNGASCENVAGDFVCHCPACFSGKTCTIRSDHCLWQASFRPPSSLLVYEANMSPTSSTREAQASPSISSSSISEIPVLVGAPLVCVFILIMLVLVAVLCGLYRRSKQQLQGSLGSSANHNNNNNNSSRSLAVNDDNCTIKNTMSLYEKQNQWNEWTLRCKQSRISPKLALKDNCCKLKHLSNDLYGGNDKLLVDNDDLSTCKVANPYCAISNPYETFLGAHAHVRIPPRPPPDYFSCQKQQAEPPAVPISPVSSEQDYKKPPAPNRTSSDNNNTNNKSCAPRQTDSSHV
ncbi:Neurogenic locus protein delta, partial [Trichinella sp. T9]